ncbi:PspC domain-containing protein [Bifidobacterium sp. CP2]|uniref:ATP-binding protein n=1 Tax=Bifidobacterium sp. CP2 TaxID=2809025 RepID=UPI001BDD001F|nr:ATP-binding protein [Bifidobacterium sp. CP2]MBT1181566.1 PspC domain-containing protein [Bifidobacterium sp. CP2]
MTQTGNQPNAGAWAPPRGTSAPLPPMRPARLPLMRPKRGRVLAGVCRGIALHLGVNVAWVRLAFVAATLIWGGGIVAYLFLWMFTPAGDPAAAAAAHTQAAHAAEAPLAHGNRDMTTGRTRAESAAEAMSGTTENLLEALRHAPKPALAAAAGLLLLVLGLSLGLTHHGALIVPTLLAVSGLLAAWSRFDARTGQLPTMILGLILIFLAYVAFVTDVMYSGMLSYSKRIIIAGFLLLVCVVLAILPWANSMIRQVTAERAMKEREEERADMTAHLHDGVLQTLALIQLHSTEPDTVFTLARSQERELRSWLYQERATTDRSVGAGLKAIAAQVEDTHGKPIDVVTVGDARPSAATDALLDATNQALVNAATHGAEPISVYCEAGPTLVEVFVRDHGPGFDVDAIPPDRLGIRESIIGRIRRRGGTVEIVSRPGWGTEVRMHMPIAAEAGGPAASAGAAKTTGPAEPKRSA